MGRRFDDEADFLAVIVIRVVLYSVIVALGILFLSIGA